MDPTLISKIEKIAEDTAYMRGQWDATIPDLKMSKIDHENRIKTMESQWNNLSGRLTMISFIGSAIMTLIGFWIKKLLNL